MTDNTTRRRVAAVQADENDEGWDKVNTRSENPKIFEEKGGKFNIVEILRIQEAAVLLCGALSWFITGESFIWNWRQLPTLAGQAKRWWVCQRNSYSSRDRLWYCQLLLMLCIDWPLIPHR